MCKWDVCLVQWCNRAVFVCLSCWSRCVISCLSFTAAASRVYSASLCSFCRSWCGVTCRWRRHEILTAAAASRRFCWASTTWWEPCSTHTHFIDSTHTYQLTQDLVCIFTWNRTFILACCHEGLWVSVCISNDCFILFWSSVFNQQMSAHQCDLETSLKDIQGFSPIPKTMSRSGVNVAERGFSCEL